MEIKYGSIEYFELLSLRDMLKSRKFDRFSLPALDKLRYEVAYMIEVANEEFKNKKHG